MARTLLLLQSSDTLYWSLPGDMPIFSIRTTQSSLGDDGGDPTETLPPPDIVVVEPSKLPVLGLYQRLVKLPEAPERLSVPVLLAFGKWIA